MAKKILLVITACCFMCAFARAAGAEDVLSWQDCIKEAAKNHPDLIAAQESIKQSQAAKQITASSLYPQIDSSVSGQTSRSSSGSGAAATHRTSDSYSYGITGSQLVFDGMKTVNEVNAAKENIKASQETYRYTSSEVRLRLRTAFISLLEAQEMVKVSEDIVKIRRDNYELITLRYQSGYEHKGALLNAEADLAQAQFQLSQAKRDIELAQRQLTKEMGRRELMPMAVKADFTVVETAKEKPDFEAMVKDHPSLKQVIAQKNAAQFGLKSSYSEFSPTLSGQAGATKAGSKWSPDGDQWNLGLTMSMPIFEGGLRIAQVSQAKALLNQLRENERSTRDGLIVSLSQYWVALQDALETVDVQHKSLIASQERSNIAEAEYSTGFISYDNWTIIEDNLVTAKRQYLQAQANALYAEANWIQAKGEVLENAQ